MRYIKINDIRPNMLSASNLYDRNHQPVMRANCRLTHELIAELTQYDYNGLYIYQNRDKIADMKNKLQPEYPTNMCQAVYLANTLINHVMGDIQVSKHLISMTNREPTHIDHYIEVALISVLIGISRGLIINQLTELTQAAILHDLGKIMIDKDILNKPEKLTPIEYTYVKNHTEFGHQLIMSDDNAANWSVANAVRHHHENHDGSGYPMGLKCNQIPVYAQIIHIADVYQAMLSNRVYKKSMAPDEAMIYMMQQIGIMFDPTMIYHFVKQIIHYPIEATVIYPGITKTA